MSYREDQLWQGLRFGVLQAEGQKITRSRKSLGGTKSQAGNHRGGGVGGEGGRGESHQGVLLTHVLAWNG